MAFKPRPPNEDPNLTHVSTIASADLNTYTYADGCESDEYEGEDGVDSPEQQLPELKQKSFANKLSAAVKGFTLPTPEEIKEQFYLKLFFFL